MAQEFPDGYAVTVAQHDGAWSVHRYNDSFDSLEDTIAAVRRLRSEGPTFALLNVENEYVVVLRPGPNRARILLSDAPIAVDDDYAADALEEAGCDIPDIDPDDLDDTDSWADGDFDILADLGLTEERLSLLLDADEEPADLIDDIADALGFADELHEALR
ncbi:tRNA adenosine deaminase-associated protein [Corynebacterium sp. UMB2355A]|uniref:tRNA adenosine deaminase-associated protein n=1 Tax=Corynebacterium sp. UMB2355A TaxID=3081222 RepID=UPI0029FF1C5D|nr:tRNA adenosine deaminase-associated protein [Corynebacterium sp. UMB2355A]WPJ92015.1 tRNA adenosine deaminase-associated protein [Corynebacterium sp. UMB2355A]